MVRRQTRPDAGKKFRELAFYRCAGPAATPLPELIRVAGARWAIEECFQARRTKPSSTSTRSMTTGAWYAHITLAVAAAYLAATRATADAESFPPASLPQCG